MSNEIVKQSVNVSPSYFVKLFTESQIGLQNCLTKLKLYSKSCKLNINHKKDDHFWHQNGDNSIFEQVED